MPVRLKPPSEAGEIARILGDEAVMRNIAFVTGTIAVAWRHRLLLRCEIRQPWGDRHVHGQE
jgi:hypothetical protein